MTSLDRARAHLLAAQNSLREARRFRNDPAGWEDMVLAALCWVWQEQVKWADRHDGWVPHT